MINSTNTVAVVLAGGRSQRMRGVKKPTIPFGGEPLLIRVLKRVSPQVSRVLVNLNESLSELDLAGYDIVPDLVPGFRGPLAGLVSGFDYLATMESCCEALLLAPCDGPFVPMDLATRLIEALNNSSADVACARYGREPQPTFSLWRWGASDSARDMLLEQRKGGFKVLLDSLNTHYVDWPASNINPFFNINAPEDLSLAKGLLGLHSG